MQNIKYQDFEIHGHLEEFLIKLKKIDDFLVNSSNRKKKAFVLSKMYQILMRLAIQFEYWSECLIRVKKFGK